MQGWVDYPTQQWKYLFEITRAIAARLDLDSVLNKSLRYAIDLVGGAAGLVVLRGNGDTFQFATRYGIEARLLEHLEPLVAEIPLAIARDPASQRRFPELAVQFTGVIDETALSLQQVLVIPLIASERLLGIIYVFRRRQKALFNLLDEDVLAGFADHVAIAVEHTRLYHEAEARARERTAVVEGSAQGILIAAPEGKIASMNRSLERLTGWTRQDASGKDYRQVLQLLDERGQAVPALEPSPDPHAVAAADGFVRRRDGARGAYVHVTLAPLYDDSHILSSLLVTAVDISALREADELKTTFLAGISHDFKTPLSLIRGYVETLRRTDVEWDRKTLDDSLAVIQDETEYLTNLVNALLDAAQLQYGHLTLQRSATPIDELASRLVERFQATRPGYHWTLEFPEGFPAVSADAERLREVLQNLLGNAAKYSPSGSRITVGGWVEPERVGVFVRDEGPGIPVEEQARLFNRFTRGRGQSAQRAEGAGLGLYLCRAIIEQHGGRIWMENLPERGTAFYFTLPRKMET